MKITYAKQAIKAIESLEKTTKQRIKKGIEGIPEGDIKRLKGYETLYRLRVGNWRVVFSHPASNEVLIENVTPRGDAH
jgi:mRNA interferase RelE/StbE